MDITNMEKIEMPETIIYQSASFDPWYNLAVEELLLNTVREDQFILYLWQNRDTIVVGKNQNPWKECRAGLLERDGGYLARRLSGGGTVFHDLGNLNFTFIMSRAAYDLGKQSGIILAAVQTLGIPAELSGRNDLTVGGRKFSGNAFCFRKNSAYHHGTLLVASDLERLTKYLRVPEDKIRSKGIASVRSRVVNLTDYNQALTIETMSDALCREFTKVYRGRPTGFRETAQGLDSLDQKLIQELYEKYASWEWRYGEASDFDLEMATRFAWGGVEIGLKLEKGIVTYAAVYSDAMDAEFIGRLSPLFRGLRLNAPAMAAAIADADLGAERRPMQAEIGEWLLTKQF
jgi:lipoate-protein ligase A